MIALVLTNTDMLIGFSTLIWIRCIRLSSLTAEYLYPRDSSMQYLKILMTFDKNLVFRAGGH